MTGKVGFISLGCPKALVDSEQLLTALTAEGYTTADDYSEADVVVVNTCGFIDAAIEESFDAIEEALDACGGNKTKAAQLLDVSYKTLLNKMRDLSL